VNNFHIMIANGGLMKFGGCSENVKLQMVDYSLKIDMFSIEMGVCDIILGAKWLWTLCPITMISTSYTWVSIRKGITTLSKES